MSTPDTQDAPKLPRRGRRPVLTQEMADTMYTMLANGNSVETAADFVGINPCTFYDWMNKGNRAQSGMYAEFAKTMKKARAIAKVALVQAISQHPSWQAKAWLLERRFPKEWGRHLVHSGKDGSPVAITILNSPPPIQIVLSGDA